MYVWRHSKRKLLFSYLVNMSVTPLYLGRLYDGMIHLSGVRRYPSYWWEFHTEGEPTRGRTRV